MPTVPSARSRSASTMIAPQPAKTSANVAKASASARLARSGLSNEVGDQPLDAGVDLVPDAANRVQALAGGIVQRPVLVPLAGIDRARVATAHGDHHVCGPDDLVGQRLRELLAHVESDLAHCDDDGGIDLLTGIAAGGSDVDTPLGAELHEPRRHLAPARVVHADEQHLRHLRGHPRLAAAAISSALP